MFHEIFVQKRKRDGYKNLFIFLSDLSMIIFWYRYIYIYTLWSIWTALLSFVTKKKKKEKEINVSLQINSLTSVIRILAVQFPGYLFKHILVAVEPANSRTATLHLLPSPRRSPTILGRINPRLPGNRNEAAGNKSGCS